jgi:hypothetical protein
MLKKTIAREWLYLLAGAVAGLILVIAALEHFTVIPPSNAGIVMYWCLPYFLFQFVRSVVWAVKTLRPRR